MKYKDLNVRNYYRKDVYQHFTRDCKCSVSITNRIDVTELVAVSKQTKTKFYINFLYLLSKVLNTRKDYRMQYLFPKEKVVVFDQVNPAHYVFHEDTETCTVVYTEYCADYKQFYERCLADLERAKQTREYGLNTAEHPNYFDASYISWLSYDALHLELPDGYLHFMPIINWGKYRSENGKLMMPVTVRMNHAVADGYLVSKVFLMLEEVIKTFTEH